MVIPVDLKDEFLSGLQYGRKLDAHHGLVDEMHQGFAQRIRNFDDVHAVIIGLRRTAHLVYGLVADDLTHGAGILVIGIVLRAVLVLIQLHPEIGELIGRIVGIRDGLGAGKALLVLI